MNISGYSAEQLAGQRLMVGFEGTKLTRELMFLIDTLRVGGIILFAGNIKTPGQVKNLCKSAQDYARSCGQPPLIIAIDQEGGQVARLKEPFTQFPGNPAMKGEEDASVFAAITASELLGVGINMDMAPVMDVAPKGVESVVSGRVFGSDPHRVSKMGVVVIEGLQAKKIMAVAKHFPGIGRTVLDSHLDLPMLEAGLSNLESFDLIPFQTAIRHDVAGIMLSHIVYTGIDDRWPASLSEKIAKNLLRNSMGYDGIVMTDDLDMGAVKNHFEIGTSVRQILSAGIDMMLICHEGPDIELAFEEVLKNMRDSIRLRVDAEKSVRRIMRVKEKYLPVW
ncbi:MAG: beta-N-acetylhexosaminidase [Desulfobacterales bacterium]